LVPTFDLQIQLSPFQGNDQITIFRSKTSGFRQFTNIVIQDSTEKRTLSLDITACVNYFKAYRGHTTTTALEASTTAFLRAG
jgi:hypothetical protein